MQDEFPHMNDVIGHGHIEYYKDGVAWGTFDTGTTFDIPVEELNHPVGDDVRLSAGYDEDEMGYSHLMMVMGNNLCTVFFMTETDTGYEVLGHDVFTRGTS